jgi:hypothetical protein
MAVDPHFLTVPPSPVPWPPDVIGAAYVITRATSIIRPVTNLDRNRAWIACVVRPWTTTIIGSVPRISSISPFTSACTERDRNQKQQQCRPFQSRFCSRSCGKCFRLRVFKNIRFHNNGIRIRVSFHAPPQGSSVNCSQAVLHWPRIAVTINVLQQNSAMYTYLGDALHHTLVEHRICNFHESGDVRSNHKITRFSVIGGGFPRILENRRHDVAQT